MALLLHLLPFASRPALLGGDEPHYALMAHSLAVDGDLSLEDDYAAVARGAAAAGRKRSGQELDRHVRTAGGRTWFAHPLGLPLLAAPFVALQHGIAPGSAPDFLLGFLTLAVTFSALIAGTRTLGGLSGDPRRGALVGLAVYFASPLWFYSRTFMTEPYLWAFGVLSLASLARGRLVLASVLLALSLAVKETAILIVAPVVGAAVLGMGLRRAWPLFTGPAVFGALFVAKNLALGAPPFATCQPYRFGASAAGLAGLLIDRQRGLLWFAPLLLLAMLGWRRAFLERRSRAAVLAGGFAFLSYYVAAALWIDWRGGACYGPRLIVPVLPVLALPLLALVDARPHRFLRGLLLAGFVAGFTVSWCAALRPVQAFWSASVDDLVLGHPVLAGCGAVIGLGMALYARRLGVLGAPPEHLAQAELAGSPEG